MPSFKRGADFRDSSTEVQAEAVDRLARRWRRVMVAVFVLVMAGLWTMVADDAAHERRLVVAAAAERDANLAIAVEHYVTRVLRTTRAVHSYLGLLVLQKRSDAELSEALADRLRANDMYQGLALCFPDGRMLTAAGPAGARLPPQLCAAVTGMPANASEVSVLPPVQLTGQAALPLAYPVRDRGGAQVAAAVALTKPDTMLGIMQSVVMRDRTWVSLFGADNALLAAWSSESGPSSPDPRLTRHEPMAANGSTVEIAGLGYYVASRNVGTSGLRVSVASAQSDVLDESRARRWRTVGLATASTAVLAALFILLWRLNAHSLSHTRELVAARAALTQSNQTLDAKVQERTTQLKSAYQDLEIFAYTLAHDVRAPLASINGFAQALEPAVLASANPKDLHYLARIRANAKRMDELTAQLLALGRLASQPVAKNSVDLSGMARELLEDFRMRDPSRQVQTRVAEGLMAYGDGPLLRQVLENLLGNAWKFTANQPHAEIEFAGAAGREGEDTFVVGDNGAGFDAQAATDIFQPFRRMHSQAEYPGNGVGLAAVQRICTRHGGRVWCESSVGAGARFYFALPRRSEA
jgi:signal transduction histidine kinase